MELEAELEKAIEYIVEGIEYTRERIECIEEIKGRPGSGIYAELQLAMENIQQGVKDLQEKLGTELVEDFQSVMEHIRRGMESISLGVKIFKMEEDVDIEGTAMGIDEGLMSIEYGIDDIRDYFWRKQMGYKFWPGQEHIREANRSYTNHVRQQERGTEDPQAMEYIRGATRSDTNHIWQQERGLEDRQGIEYIRETTRSDTNHAWQQERGFEDKQEMEYIHEATRSDTTHAWLQERGLEDPQGMEYIREAARLDTNLCMATRGHL